MTFPPVHVFHQLTLVLYETHIETGSSHVWPHNCFVHVATPLAVILLRLHSRSFFFPSLEYPRTHTARWMDMAGGGEGWTIIYMNFHTPHISIVNIIPRLKLSGQLPSMNCCRDQEKLISELFEEVRRREWRISKKEERKEAFSAITRDKVRATGRQRTCCTTQKKD